MDKESLVAFGSEVKSLGIDEVNQLATVGGYLVLYGNEDERDFEDEWFDDATDYGPHTKSVVYFNHGLDPELGTKAFTHMAELEKKDVGVWVEHQLDLRDAYEAAVYELVQQRKLGWSSGTASHLTKREALGKGFRIQEWPLGVDASYTTHPADYRNVVEAKSLTIKTFEQLLQEEQPDGDSEPEAPVKADDAKTGQVPAGDGGSISFTKTEDNLMTDETRTEAPAEDANDNGVDARIDAMEAKFSQTLEKILDHMESAPPIKNSGYFTDAGGTADAEIKSLGDFLISVRRGDVDRIRNVYKSRKALAEDSGATGGYLVPPEMSADLLQAAQQQSPILQMVTRVNVNSASGEYPVLDQFVTPTAGAGNTAYAAGVTQAAGQENTTLTETEPGFEVIKWRVNKVGGFTAVSSELSMDSPQAIETLLRSLYAMAIANKQERDVIRGTGAGEAQGILEAAAAIGVTPGTNNVFSFTDTSTMLSRFKTINGRIAWLIHPGIIPDIHAFEVGTGGSVYVANQRVSNVGTDLHGYPVIMSEHMPQDDNSGCVILADLSAYLLFVRSELEIAFSEHVGFKEDQHVWRFTARYDGQPWMRSAITLADPQGSYTVSPFVYLND